MQLAAANDRQVVVSHPRYSLGSSSLRDNLKSASNLYGIPCKPAEIFSISDAASTAGVGLDRKQTLPLSLETGARCRPESFHQPFDNHHFVSLKSSCSSPDLTKLGSEVYNRATKQKDLEASKEVPIPIRDSEKQVVDSICSMGFSAALVVRAMRKLGTDDKKKIVAYLLCVQSFCLNGWDPEIVEEAVFYSDTNDEKEHNLFQKTRAMPKLLTFIRYKSPIFTIFGRTMSSLDKDFNQAKERLNSLAKDPGNEAKLKLYALFKQEDAKKNYIAFVEQLGAGNRSRSSSDEKSEISEDQRQWILTRKEGRVFHIILNRVLKKNALTIDMYTTIKSGLDTAAVDEDTLLTVISANGDYFSSGNDLANFLGDISDKAVVARQARNVLEAYVASFIDHPKPLVALINGPAIGIFVTILALFDIVYASDKATFHAPLISLGQSPEGCSSFTFPRLMGLSKATELLLFGKKLTAVEACKRGLVTEVFPHNTFERETMERIQTFSQLPPQSVILSKKLMRELFRRQLHDVNVMECELLQDRWQSDECAEAVMKFFSAKSKL